VVNGLSLFGVNVASGKRFVAGGASAVGWLSFFCR
jgi:hypothetical protein